MFDLSLCHAGHTRRYSISAAPEFGWEVRLEEDHQLRRLDRYEDWHRVERAMALFKLEVLQLRERGWLAADAAR